MSVPTIPAKRHSLRWVALACGLLVIAGLIGAWYAVGKPDIRRWFQSSKDRPVVGNHEPQAQLVAGSKDEIELPSAVVERLGVRSAPIEAAAAPRPLELAGSLFFNPDRLGGVQSRFAGEIVTIGTTTQYGIGPTRVRPLEYGDQITQGQVMAVVQSKDLGEKKSELVDTMVKQALDEIRLEDRKLAYKRGALSEDTLNQTHADVATDRNAVARVERTLRTWKVSEEEIKAVKEEARLVSEGKKQRDAKKEMEWAKVEVRAPFDGTIVEKNAYLGRIIDSTFDLFKVADLRKLGVVVHAYEEDLRTLQGLPPGFPWEVRAGADLNHRTLQSNGLQKIGLVVDPTQHTDPVMGLVENSSGELRVGQFVTATVRLPAPPKVVSVPVSAVVEDGHESIVFVQSDPAKRRYALRRVSVAMRLRDAIYVRSELTEAERKKALEAVKPGEVLVTEGALELQAALEDLQAKAKAQK